MAGMSALKMGLHQQTHGNTNIKLNH